jgi:hypothetical protein
MDTRTLLLTGLALHGALLAGCSSSSSATTPGGTDGGDSSVASDGGHTQPTPDSGAKSHPDSGAAHDGGAHGPDGSPTPDASQPPGDTGTPTPDAATPPADTGTTTNPDASTVGGIPGGQAGPGTTVSGCEIFPPDNPWNVRIDGPNVQVVTTYTGIPQGTTLHADFGDFSPDGYGIPYAVVPATQADEQVTFGCYADESDPGPGGWTTAPAESAADCAGGGELGVTKYPFFAGMKIEGNPATGSGGTPGGLPGDQHALVVQQGASGCTLWEAWNCVESAGPPFNCANGAKFDLTSNGLRTLGWTSADAAGLPIFAGLVRLADVKAGAINHAIRVTFQDTQFAYILPATHAAGSSTDTTRPPMGLRLRLKSSVDISSYPAPAQVVLKAMQQYGLIVADIGSNWYFQGDSDDGWNVMDATDTWLGEVAAGTSHMHGSDFEAIDSGPVITTGL